MKKISVIIPCYNVALYIDRCLTSITVQTIGIDRLEIICVDDASTDDTWEHLQRWERLFPDNVILIHQEVNRRQGAARNVGLHHSSADWVSFVDADDWLEPDYLEQLYRPVDQFKCDVVACRCGKDASSTLVFFDEEQRWGGGEEGFILADTEEMTKGLFRSKYLGEAAWGKLIRKELLVHFSISFPEDLAYEDSYWIPLLHIYARGVYIIQKRLYHYFINPDSTMLAKNAVHHIDMITVQLIKWADYDRRGIWQEYHEELELDSLCLAACFMRTLILQYDRPPFSYFQLIREIIKVHVPDYRNNPYIAELDPLFRLFLEILYSTIDKTGFLQIVDRLKM